MADVTIPEPEIGARFRDRFSEGFEWEVTEHEDPSLVRLRAWFEGEPAEATLDWPANRWAALFEGKQMLVPPGSP